MCSDFDELNIRDTKRSMIETVRLCSCHDPFMVFNAILAVGRAAPDCIRTHVPILLYRLRMVFIGVSMH
jgi:hypothetical protein